MYSLGKHSVFRIETRQQNILVQGLDLEAFQADNEFIRRQIDAKNSKRAHLVL